MTVATKYILILGCFDTKGEVFSFLRQCILARGEDVLTINTGVMGTTNAFPVDFEAEQLASEAGHLLTDLREKGDRGHAVEVMGRGAAKVIAKLIAKNQIKAAIGMGGGGGTFIALSAMQAIPLAVPKLCLTTIATKDLSRQMGNKNISLMPSVVDIAGLNSISKLLIAQAAASICAMANVSAVEVIKSAGNIAISMFGNTTACVEQCSALIKAQGYEVLAFHATGVGGKTMEALIREGYFVAVLDITTTELADEACGGILSAGPERLTAAAEIGIPQVVAPGCLDMVNFAQRDTVPERYQSRKLYNWAPDVTLMRTNEDENQLLGEMLAERLNHAIVSATILLPNKGISQIDNKGGVFYQPETNRVLFNAIKNNVNEKVKVIEIDAHINDQTFAEFAVKILLGILQEK